jgi:hypothetical protein
MLVVSMCVDRLHLGSNGSVTASAAREYGAVGPTHRMGVAPCADCAADRARDEVDVVETLE